MPDLDPAVARLVKRARETLTELASDPGWHDEMPQWIGRLSSQLERLCDAVGDEPR